MSFAQLSLCQAAKFARGNNSLLKSVRLTAIKEYGSLVNTVHRNESKILQSHVLAPINTSSKLLPAPLKSIGQSPVRLMSAGGNHTTLWTVERAVSLGLLLVIPTAFIMPSQTLDALMAVSLVLHSHWGIEAMITDYVRPSVVGNVVPKLAHAFLLLLSMASLGGLFYMIYNDIGIANTVKKLWAVKASA